MDSHCDGIGPQSQTKVSRIFPDVIAFKNKPNRAKQVFKISLQNFYGKLILCVYNFNNIYKIEDETLTVMFCIERKLIPI